jgi:23S rRNA (uracil1939-C5)-methyltransferase
MIGRALERLDLRPSDRVLDLFCGLGNFTLPMARRAAHVTGVEGDARLIAGARRNAAFNAIGNTEFHVADLFEPKDFGPWADAPYDAVLIDPPRAGAREAVEQMSRWAARRVVYISCHPGSLARDAGILVQTQGYEMIAAGVMDMFPHTTHIEAIAVFEKRV